jgi:signal transduction histidine kinase
VRELDYKNYKILLVDDELVNLENLIFAFELDYSLTTASSAKRALEIVDREDIAVVVSDQRMPDVTGVELLSRIKETQPRIVRMLITAYSDMEAAIDAINKGDIYRYISKDLPMNHIETIIKQAIEYYQMQEDLEAATQALIKSEKLITIAEMAAGFGHEIRNTVSGMTLGIDNVIEQLRIKGFSDPQVDHLLVKTKEYSRRSIDIVDRINDFARPGHIEKVDLYKVVDSSIEMARDGLKKLLYNIDIIKEMEENIPMIEGNAVHFEQILLNLIRNACQAMEDTGGKIIVKVTSDNDWIYMIVQDTGPGIPEENLNRVFGAFYTTKKEGMGMGLYLIDNIAKTFGGRLELESELGKGSTFTVVLPIKPLLIK